MSDEQYEISWNNQEIKLEDVTSKFGNPPADLNWFQVQEHGAPCRWENLEEDMKKPSAKFPGTLFTVEITDFDTRDKWMSYHKDGLHYEAREESYIPAFNKNLLKA